MKTIVVKNETVNFISHPPIFNLNGILLLKANVLVTCAKSNEDLAKAKFFSEIAKAKNAQAFGVRCTSWFGASRFFDIS